MKRHFTDLERQLLKNLLEKAIEALNYDLKDRVYGLTRSVIECIDKVDAREKKRGDL